MAKVGRLSIPINLFNVCRHYIAKSVLRDNLDLMEMNKFNVFHWHMTDDNSFPYVSKRFPNLRWEITWDATIALKRLTVAEKAASRNEWTSNDSKYISLQMTQIFCRQAVTKYLPTQGITFSWKNCQPLGIKTRCQIWCTIEFHRDPISKVLSEW